MNDLLLILVGAVLVNNLVLTRFLGLCPVFGTSAKLETAIGMSLATTFVLTLAAALAFLVERYVLLPLDLDYLRIITFILVIAAVAKLTELMVLKVDPLLHQLLGIFLPLVASNCAILGIVLLNAQESHSFLHSVFYGFGAGAGFSLVLVLFAAIRERVAVADVPRPFRGAAIAMITAGIMSLAFMGFTGLIST
ncbi:MAG: electron transport complex subunit RsxA [Gammaproteobacteria bacterium]|nr:electron transport complex subunit RsxA [Gammaproteobacteria bacterium]